MALQESEKVNRANFVHLKMRSPKNKEQSHLCKIRSKRLFSQLYG